VSGLLDRRSGARRGAAGRGLDDRLLALGEAAELAGGRLEPVLVEEARAVARRAGERLGHGLEATVVALAGPTGAGKSTLFNVLAGRPLVREGVRRPTTSTVTAATWGGADSGLLDWLEVPARHRLDGGGDTDGLVLLDLPDFDSVEASHRLEVDRLVRLVDLLVWVVDPQKYADAALHEHYLRPLASHAAAMLVVLNQATGSATTPRRRARTSSGCSARRGSTASPCSPPPHARARESRRSAAPSRSGSRAARRRSRAWPRTSTPSPPGSRPPRATVNPAGTRDRLSPPYR